MPRATSSLHVMAGDGNSILASIRRFFQRTYAADYIGLACLTAGYYVLQWFALPFHHLFSLDNQSIQYPHAEVERVPITWLFIYSIGAPCVVMIPYLLLTRSNAHKFHISLLGLAISLSMTGFVTNIIKNAVGRPRPDLISRCKPKARTPPSGLIGIEVCTETDPHTLQDGWRSFPSGHSSFAFSGLGYLSIFLAGQMEIFRPGVDVIRFLLASAPLLGAALIAISRLEDYRHDPFDVSAGSLLGLSIAVFSYRRYYPNLRSHRCNIPHPIPETTVYRMGVDEESRLPDEQDFELADDSSSEILPLTSVQNQG